MNRRSITVLALVFLAGAAVALGGFFVFGHDRAAASDPGYGSPMMGGAYGGGMMGGGARRGPGMMGGAFGGGAVRSSVSAAELRSLRDRVEKQLATWGYKSFTVGEVMAFTNNDYVLVKDGSDKPAFELLADPQGRWMMPEPTMMWNTAYGMMRGFAGNGGYGMMGSYGCPWVTGSAGSKGGSPLSAAQAKTRADAWLAQNRSGEVTADATPLPGYYTIDVTKDGGKVGMLSVNEKTGAVWYHTWHASLLADQDF